MTTKKTRKLRPLHFKVGGLPVTLYREGRPGFDYEHGMLEIWIGSHIARLHFNDYGLHFTAPSGLTMECLGKDGVPVSAVTRVRVDGRDQ